MVPTAGLDETTHAESSAASSATTTSSRSAASRDEFATKLVERFALWSAAAGIIPIPLVDIAAVGGLQLQMVRRISQIYDVPFAENRGKALIVSLAGAMIPTSSGIGTASVLKAVPVVGYVFSAMVLPALSSGATYAIGRAFIHHFATGGTFLDFNPPDYREFIKSQKEMWSSKSDQTVPQTGQRPTSNHTAEGPLHSDESLPH